MPAELAHLVPAPSVLAGPTAEDRWAAVGVEMHCIKLIAKYLGQEDQRTKEHDDEALLAVCMRASNIFQHVEECTVTAARFDHDTRVILYRLALAHRERIAKEPLPPQRKSTARDPRRRLPSPPGPVAEPHKDMSNDGSVARTHARRAPIATQPYQRSARPAARKHKKVEDVEDVPEAIAASVRTAQAGGGNELPQVLGAVSIADLAPASLDDLCALFGSTSLRAPASAAEDASCDPAPAGANHDAYLPTHVPTPTPTPSPPPAQAAPRSRGVRAKSLPPARMNPLDRSGRRRGKTAQL